MSNAKLLAKARDELRLSDEHAKEPRELLKECLHELEEKGFLNLMEKRAD